MADWYEDSMRAWFQTVTARMGTSRIAAVTPVSTSAPAPPPATSEEEAHVRLLFEEDDALQRRVANTIAQLFFGAQGVYGTKPAHNCDALFKQLVKNAAPNDEFRKLVERTFRKEIEGIVNRIATDAIDTAVRMRVAEMGKFSRRISAAPKGPRK